MPGRHGSGRAVVQSPSRCVQVSLGQFSLKSACCSWVLWPNIQLYAIVFITDSKDVHAQHVSARENIVSQAPTYDVLVIGGGNAALCAALTAREAGASVLMLEAAPREWRGGNSQHTRNLRCMHDGPQDVLVDAYPEEEFWQDLLKVTGGKTNEELARLVIRTTATCRDWMRKHGVRFQPALAGTLHVARTNAFFMGGGKALVNAYYRSAEKLGVQVRYETPVKELVFDGNRFVAAITESGERIEARSAVLAAGGFESNREWL